MKRVVCAATDVFSLRFVCLTIFLFGLPALSDTVTPIEDVTTYVRVREGPSSAGAQVGRLNPGEQAELVGSVPNWHHIRLANGAPGFVSKRWTRILSTGPVPPPGVFTIDVVDVGTGLGVLVRGPDFTLVYDGGSNDDLARGDNNRMLAYIRAVLPTLTSIDHIILSHPHRDHVELLPDILAAYQIRHVWDSGRVHDICGYRAFLAAVRNEPGVEYHNALQHFGTRSVSFAAKTCYDQNLPAEVISLTLSSRISDTPVQLGQNASMVILHADGSQHSNPNENSIVVRLNLGNTRVLLMGDAEAGSRSNPSMPPLASSIEGELLACCAADLAAHVMIVAHHGSKTSSRRAFLDAVSPSILVVSSGPMEYGHHVVLPDQVVINELKSRGQVFRTDDNDNGCSQNPAKIGPDNDGEPGGCTNIRIALSDATAPQVSVFSVPD